MKFNTFLIGLFLFTHSLCWAQNTSEDTLIQHYYQFPEEALQAADKMHKRAEAEHNSPLLIKSLILKTTFSLQLNQDEYPKFIQEIEANIARSTDLPTKSILHSYAGELYCQYFGNNRYLISQRGLLQGAVPEDMKEWSSNIFQDTILSHFSASIVPAKILQELPISLYNEMLIHTNGADSLRPTLYDFLINRAIELLSNNSYLFDNTNSDNENANLLDSMSIFLVQPILPQPQDATSYILKFWQDLLRFRSQQPQQQNALLMADLNRLNYCLELSNLKDKYTLYLQTLKTMREQYINTPMVIEIIAQEAQKLQYNTTTLLSYSSSPSEKKENKEEVIALCKEGIRLYPHYTRINLLNNLLEMVYAPEIKASFPKSIYPGEKLNIKISSLNLDKVDIQLFRIDTTSIYYTNIRNQDSIRSPRTLISDQSYTLRKELIKQDTTFQLTVPQTGLYEVVIKAPKAKHELSNTFICTQLFCISQTTETKNNFQVRDWISGKPIKNAKILIYQRKDYSYPLLDSVFSNEKGLASYAFEKLKNYAYEVINKENPNNYIENLHRPYSRSREMSNTTLITDREIYRPGQTVYFQGISWISTPDTLYPLVNDKVQVTLRDPKYKLLSQQQFVTDSFGSFSGSFILPTLSINGYFTLETENTRTNIIISDYKRPEYDILFDHSEKIYLPGDSVHITGRVKSYSGITLANEEVQYHISPRTWGYSSFTANIQGITHTDQQGKFEIHFKIDSSTLNTSSLERYFSLLTYQITAKVTDPKGETQESTTYVTAYLKPTRPRLEIPEKVNKVDSTPFIIQLDNPPVLIKSRNFSYSIAKLVSPSQITDFPSVQDTIIERVVQRGELTLTQNDTIYPNLSYAPSGAYLFSLKCQGEEVKQIFYLYSTKDKRPPIPTYNWLVREKTTCAPGESARIQFGTSVKNAYVVYELYTTEKLIQRKYVTLSNEILNIDIPYLSEYGNTIWLSIYYVKDKKYIHETISINKLLPKRLLTIRTSVFRDHLLPGQEEEWKIQILNEQGQPAIAQVLAFMYDASLDKLANHNVIFRPEYLNLYFRSNWGMPDFYNTLNFSSISPWNFNKVYYPYPVLYYEKLNTFSKMAYGHWEPEATIVSHSLVTYSTSSNDVLREASVEAVPRFAKSQAAPVEVQYRDDFQETAFFYPQLPTDSAGNVTIRFTLPQSLTQWKFNVLAYNKTLDHGQLVRYITASKPLMVRPNLPRFFRSGDRAMLKVTVSNLSDSLQQGATGIELFLPGNQQVILKSDTAFQIDAQNSQTFNFNLDIPENIDLIGCRIYAGNSTFNDGEQHLIPILPNETLITETLPIFSTRAGSHTYTLKNSSTTRKDYRLTLELAANPIWYAVLALPALVEPANESITDITASFYVNTLANRIVRSNPQIAATIRQWSINKNDPTLLSRLEQNSELKSILLEASPWMLEAQNETEQIQQLAQLFDENRLHYLQNQALSKLGYLQNEDGSWSWFKGMYSSRFITTNVLTMMSRCTTTGEYQPQEAEKMMQVKALRYLDEKIREDFKNESKIIGYEQILYLYVRSLYLDIPLGDALEAHKHFMLLAEKQWVNFSLYEKALIAQAMFQYGFKSEARNILKSLRQYAVNSPELGMYWPNNHNYFFRNSAVQIHTAIMETFHLIAGNTPEINLMQLWLLRQKQVQNWGNIPSTVDAIHALLLTDNNLLENKDQITARIGNHQLSTSNQSNPLGYLKTSYSAGEIHPNMFTVEISKQKDTPSWGGLYLQYFEKLDQVKKQKTDLSIDKKLFTEKINAQGKKELFPLNQQNLKTGDKVIIRLTLSLTRDMEFLHLKDMRAACFEPTQQLSGIQWKFGTVYYQDTRDAVTNFFFNSLGRGTYVIEYPVWVNQAGSYQDGVASFQSMYAPEYSAVSTASKLTIVP